MSNTVSGISRREFLAGSLLSGAALTLGNQALGVAPTDGVERWVLLADAHISGDRSREGRGIKPVDKLGQARAEIMALKPRPMGVIVAGDCAYGDGQAGDYAVLKEELKPLDDAGVPVHMAMGNHDNRERFWTAFPEARARSEKSGLKKHAYVVEGRHADWFVLDSTVKTGVVHGEMGGQELEWLAAELDRRPDKPALLVAHHYPSVSEDDNGLRDFDAFWSVIQHRKRVKAYFFGHSHKWVIEKRDGVHLVNLPALAWLFEEAQPRAWVEAALGPDGLRLQLHCLDDTRAANGTHHDLNWRG